MHNAKTDYSQQPELDDQLREPLDDEERELMDPDTWDWDNVQEVTVLPGARLVFEVSLNERELAEIEPAAIAKGMTVILTTHDLGDIEELCRRVIIIDDGRIIYDGPIETIKKKFGKFREITFDTVEEVKGLDLPKGSELLSTEDHKVQIRFDRTVSTASQVAGMVMNQIEVRDFSLSEPELSDIVKQIYNGALEREAR